MNKSQIALLLVRLTGFQFVVGGIDYLTYLPERFFAADHFGSVTSASLAQMQIKLLLARAILHITLGVALWFFSQPVIKFFTAGSSEL